MPEPEQQSAATTPRHQEIGIAIIGDGYAAATMLIQLDERGVDPERVTVFGDTPPENIPNENVSLGSGKAYGTANPNYRLNVRADLMKLRPDDAEFSRWAETEIDDGDAATHAGDFYRRCDFARFTAETLTKCASSGGWVKVRSRATRLTPDRDGGWRVMTADGGHYQAGMVVLATGNPDGNPSFTLDPPARDWLEDQPWKGVWDRTLKGDERIAIIGGGLTAMDILTTLFRHGHDGKVDLITPGGMLPPMQANWPKADEITPDGRVTTAHRLLRLWRANLPDDDWETPQWQSAFEGLRACLPTIWHHLPRQERIRAGYRLSRHWQLARFRASPQTVAAARAMLNSGQLELHSGRVEAMTATDQHAHLTLTNGQIMLADRVMMATGAGRDPLVQQCHDDGLLPRAMQGVEVDHDFQVYDHHWRPTQGLYAFGPPTAFSRGDVLGAGSIAKEASALADRLSDRLSVRMGEALR